MNKIIIAGSLIISCLLARSGVSFSRESGVLNAQRTSISGENEALYSELEQKVIYVKTPAVEMGKAFDWLINVMRILEIDSGTSVQILPAFESKNQNLHDYLTVSSFRNVKALPLMLKVTKISKQTSLICLLHDLHVLEKLTDLRINEIVSENEVFEVKGELYGV